MESQEFVETMRKVPDADPKARERAADEIADHLSAYSPAQASALATLLSASAVCETAGPPLEAELNAIIELMSTGHINFDHVSQLKQIEPGELRPELREYVTDILEG
ncbi:hypothetical protein ACWEV4_25130 [Streptomyces sp. NPDC003860]